ncbi:MAG: hypothetical protein IJJ94_03770 [Bacteroidaceae bacterium]|nr:hypothetical protein [Bacteroidaceae bacterium]
MNNHTTLKSLMRTSAFLLALFTAVTLRAQLVDGKSYRIVSAAAPEKALMTLNSSLDNGADVVLWTTTDVASECWTPTTTTTTILRNAYSRIPLAAASTTAGAKLRQSRSGAGRWTLEAIDEAAGLYKMKIGSLYLTASSTDDASVPQLADATDDATQQWRFVEVAEPKTAFTRQMREEMIDAYIRKAVESKGTGRKTFGGGGWGESEQLEVVLDAYETTGREDYLQLALDVYSWFNANVGVSWNKLVYTDAYHWFGHDFNDDVMWQILAVARLGLLSNNRTLITLAKRNFDIIYNRAYIPFTGLLRWAQSSGDPYGTNSCINGPAEVAACYLGFAGCGDQYFEKARELYTAQRYVLANNLANGKVWDSVVWDPSTEKVKSHNEWASTYNQGTMLGAACMLYKYYGDEQYLADAKKIMRWTKGNLCDSHGIVNACQVTDGDLVGFKGILMRYVRRFIRDCASTDYQAWSEANALHAYCNRSAEGVTPTAWLQKGTAANTVNDFSLSTAASAAANLIFDGDPALPYDERPQEKEEDPISVNPASHMAWSGIYVGGHIRRERPTTIAKLRESGFTYVLLFNVHVNPDGTLLTDGETICENGQYVFDRTQPHYLDDINTLKDENSAIHRIEIVIGGWGNDSYDNIKAILQATPGSLAQTALYRNFRALKQALPIIDGVNNDDEQCYDAATAVRFHAMMYDLGYRTSIAPYTNKTFWQSLVNQLNAQRPGACDRVLIQCYDGGAGNNPANWHFGDIPLLAGRTNYQTDMATSVSQMQAWHDQANVAGGFVWVYNDETWNLKEWATGINRIFAAAPTADDGTTLPTAATLCLDRGFGGYTISLPEGRYSAGELAAYGFPAANATYFYHTLNSVSLAPDYQITIYTQGNFEGSAYTATESTSQLPASVRSRIVSVVVEPKPDAIESIMADSNQESSKSKVQSPKSFDLAGRRVSAPSRPGLYIVDGKKVVVR